MSFPSPGTDPAPSVDPDPDESKLHSLLLAAAADVVGPSLAREVFSIARERPRRTPAGSSPPAPRTPAADFRCHAPVTLFRRLLARATRGGAPSPRETEPLPRRALGEDFGDEIREEDEIRVFADEIVRTSEKQTSAIRVVSVSSYGTVRSRTYASAEALADAIVEAADPKALGALVADVRVEKRFLGEEDENRRRIGVVDEGFGTTESSNTETCAFVNDDTHDTHETHETHDARVRERRVADPKDTRSRETSRETFRNKTRPKKLGGEIRFVTASRMRDARTYDLLLCRSCGAFLQGDKGLREHCQVRHGTSYEASLERVADARNALVVFVRAEPPRAERRGSAEAPMGKNADPSVFARPVAQKKTRARDGLPLGLRLARDGHLSALRALVADTGWDPTSHTSVDANGSCALHWAAGGGFLETCAYLVDVLREDPRRAQEKDGRAAIHWAARNGRLETCRWLVHTCGVSVDEATHDGTTPFMWCVWGGGGGEETDPRETTKTSDDDEASSSTFTKKKPALRDARDFAGALSWLVRDAKCDVHATNAFGCNASQWAAQRATGSVAMCAYLRDAGVDLTVLNRNGHSAVHKAAVKGNRDACEWLLARGGLGLPHLRADGDGNTPGEMARLEGHEALAAWLAEKTRTLEEERSARRGA